MAFLLLPLKLLLCLAAAMVLAAKNPVHSVLFLILTFCNGAGLLLLLGFDFLAMAFLVVYVGAVAVLFLFIVMMLNLKIPGFRQSLLNHYPVSLLLLAALLVEVFHYLGSLPLSAGGWVLPPVPWVGRVAGSANIHLVGHLLYTHYAVAFLGAGVVLLVAMVAAIFLTLGGPIAPSAKRQDIYLQVVRSNCVRLALDPTASAA